MSAKKPKIGSIRWHEQKLKEKREKARLRGKRNGFGKKKGDNLYNNVENRKKPETRYRSRVEYDFLKYIRVVMRWATENHPELSRGQIELLLYLYTLGAFSQNQFNQYHRILGMYAAKTMDLLIDHGYIRMWRAKRGRVCALYVLTHKAKLMCNRMHKFCVGEEEMPESARFNNIAKGKADSPRINNYYMDIIKRMNKDKAPTDEEE